MLFPHPRTHMGGGGGANPHAIWPVIEIELWNKDQNESLGCSESNGTRFDLFRAYLDPSRSGQRKKDSDLRIYRFSQITFELRKIADEFKHHRVPLVKTHRNIYFLTSGGQVENLTSGQSNMMIDLS